MTDKSGNNNNDGYNDLIKTNEKKNKINTNTGTNK